MRSGSRSPRLPSRSSQNGTTTFLFCVHDRSEGVERTVPIVVRLLGIARYRPLRGLVDDLPALVKELGG